MVDQPDCYLIRVCVMLTMADLLLSKVRIDPSVVECRREGLTMIKPRGINP